MAEDSEIKKDDIEHKLDEIRTLLGIQTTTVTTSSVLDDIRRKLTHIENQLKNDRQILWFCLLPLQIGIAFVIAGGANWFVSVWTRVVTGAGIAFMTFAYLNVRRYDRKVKIDKETSDTTA
jgi:hypothetical protein